jgi:competence protein ComGC
VCTATATDLNRRDPVMEFNLITVLIVLAIIALLIFIVRAL